MTGGHGRRWGAATCELTLGQIWLVATLGATIYQLAFELEQRGGPRFLN